MNLSWRYFIFIIFLDSGNKWMQRCYKEQKYQSADKSYFYGTILINEFNWYSLFVLLYQSADKTSTKLWKPQILNFVNFFSRNSRMAIQGNNFWLIFHKPTESYNPGNKVLIILCNNMWKCETNFFVHFWTRLLARVKLTKRSQNFHFLQNIISPEHWSSN